MAYSYERIDVPVPRCPMETHTRWTITLPDDRSMVVERTSDRQVSVRGNGGGFVYFDPDCVSALCEAMTKCVQEIRGTAK